MTSWRTNVQSLHDQCFWVKPGMMVMVYVDDCEAAAKNVSEIDQFVADLRLKGFDLTKEGSFTAFLGISLNWNNDGSIILTQKGLIKKLLEASGMEACKGNSIPASTNTLGSNLDGDPMDESWSYPSIVGMSIYLATHTRPDISFAVSQVARFSANPKQVHTSAVKTIF
jgi:Reverse transcriptase (RNA-dependent DNA polymerase)